MSPERYKQARDLFVEVLDVAEDQRDAFLNEHCSDDSALRAT